MTLFKTSLLNGIAVLIKIITLLSLNKVLAVYVGPSGYALLGQFQNVVQIFTTLASGAVNTGVTKYTAEYFYDERKQHALWKTAGTISLISTVIVAAAIIWFNEKLAVLFLKDSRFSGVFSWFALTLVFLAFNSLFLAILNGKKEVKRYVVANIAGSLIALVTTALMTISFGLYGALVALAIYQSMAFFVTITLLYRAPWFRIEYVFGRIDRTSAQNLFKFVIMALVSTCSIPLSHILIRNYLGNNLGFDAAGYWEAMWRLSAAYLMLVTTTLRLYFLPRLSELRNPSEIRKELLEGYKLLIPFTIICGILIYVMRDPIMRILFTTEFIGMEVLIGWQIVGDSLKIASWLIGYILVAKAMVGWFIFSELAFSIMFYTLVYFMVPKWGLQGSAVAHAVNYALYFGLVFFVVKLKKVI